MKLKTFVPIAILLSLAACGRVREQIGSESTTPAARNPKGSVKLTFTYGSEKEEWIKDVTAAFNAGDHRLADGRTIEVEAIPLGSGDCIDELLTESRKADITSPASAAFIQLGNAESRTKTGKDLIGPTENLVISPVVIAMWKPMAEALGYGQKPVGWGDILTLASDSRGWGKYGHPEWGPFRFGHTSPESSNSGLISIFAEAYAATGKKAGLTVADIDKPSTAQFVAGIERSIVHYGSSTGFFGRKMFANGPEYLSAAVMYENMVTESYAAQYSLPFPVVAIYPKEGTFWSDHPVGVVQRPWVTPEKREAARIYIDYLLAKPQQEKAIPYGFRPGAVDVPLASPIDTAHGVDPKEPLSTLEVPQVEVMHAILALWHANKKHANITLAFDTSGSMKENRKMENARAAALQLVDQLSDDDQFSLLPFSGTPEWAMQRVSIREGRNQAKEKLGGLYPHDGTGLYDAISMAYAAQLASQNQDAERISAIVVLTDGEDEGSKISLDELLSQIKFDNERHTIRVFTIAYGDDAKKDILTQIADATQAKFYAGNQQNIRQVLREISTFF
ncbi:MAG TPA: VWA domain-containing protein [Thermoanaerobaculia bacterium]|jgi:Ca-activated chloride channel family protein|nr:VWA domain-containing protein [Thermoanaerobaculia bacterium]